MDEWPHAQLYQAGSNVDIEVILPGTFTPLIFNNGKAPRYMPGFKAEFDDCDNIIVSSPKGLKYLYDEQNDYKIKFVKDAADVNIIEFTYDSNGMALQQNDLINTNYHTCPR